MYWAAPERDGALAVVLLDGLVDHDTAGRHVHDAQRPGSRWRTPPSPVPQTKQCSTPLFEHRQPDRHGATRCPGAAGRPSARAPSAARSAGSRRPRRDSTISSIRAASASSVKQAPVTYESGCGLVASLPAEHEPDHRQQAPLLQLCQQIDSGGAAAHGARGRCPRCSGLPERRGPPRREPPAPRAPPRREPSAPTGAAAPRTTRTTRSARCWRGGRSVLHFGLGLPSTRVGMSSTASLRRRPTAYRVRQRGPAAATPPPPRSGRAPA